jgi:group I intron endonuclease
LVIYRATNLINNKIYIGKTIHNIEYRKNSHFCYALTMNYDTLFYRAIRKYSKDAFVWDVLFTCDDEEQLNKKEIEYIALYDSRNRLKGYNISKGGEGGDNISKNPNRDAILKKISIANTGKVRSPEVIANYRLKMKGRKVPQDVLIKRSISLKGRVISAEHRKKISMTLTGRKVPEEIVARMRAKLLGRKFTQERKESMSRACKGKLLTQETKDKIKLSWVNRRMKGLYKKEMSPESKEKISRAKTLYWRNKKNEQKTIT